MTAKFGEVQKARFVFTERVVRCDDGLLRTQAEVTEAGLGGVLVGRPGSSLPVAQAKEWGLLPEPTPKARKGTANKSRKGATTKSASGKARKGDS